ncbi:MAG TPA: 5'-3' exonuclease H3TH domain-containing protein, partial [Chloroflexota bacterium]|nr:5'-3' exonuclease H3TH domain-containing protein [Chloroflexota bacterium]
MSNTIVLVDGNSLIHRAFHATPPMTTTKGELTNAVFAFARMIFRALNTLQPAYGVVAFDRRAPTFRHVEFDAYKAHRPSGPEGLFEQFGRVRELVEILGLQISELDGFEADDVLGTLSARAAEQGLEVVIVSGDTDALQLVSDQVRVLMPRKGMSDTVLYDPAAVVERYGLLPHQLIDFKALKGDPSDNIPGVPGIGEKTAAKLLARWSDVDNLLAHLSEVEPRYAKAITDAADTLAQARHLVTIVRDAPIALDLTAARVDDYDSDKLDTFLRELEFRIPLNERPPRRLSPSRSAQIALFGATDTPLEETAQAVAASEDSAAEAEVGRGEYAVIDEAALPALVERLEKSGGFALDVETTDVDPMRATLVGISVSDA